MKNFKTGKYSEEEIVSIFSEGIKKAKVLIYPTDTVYGLGCGISFSKSVKKIFEIKKRWKRMPLSVAFSDLEMLREYATLSKGEEKLIKKHLNEPYTFIVRKNKKKISDLITAGSEKVGVRIPNFFLIKEIIKEAKIPIITTSANISGESAPIGIENIPQEIKEKVDLILDSGRCKIGKPSKVIDLKTKEVLREI